MSARKCDEWGGWTRGASMSAVEDGRVHNCIPVFPMAASGATMIIRNLVCIDAASTAGEGSCAELIER